MLQLHFIFYFVLVIIEKNSKFKSMYKDKTENIQISQ